MLGRWCLARGFGVEGGERGERRLERASEPAERGGLLLGELGSEQGGGRFRAVGGGHRSIHAGRISIIAAK